MQRIPEAELMEGEEQALAYARANFDEPHAMFIRLFQEDVDHDITGMVLDLGCGTADITVRFAKAYPQCRLDGIDGSKSMLHHAHELLAQSNLIDRVNLIHGYIPGMSLSDRHYDAVISNSLLHHLQDPMVLWDTIRQCAKPKVPVFVMDLLRPEDEVQANNLVEENAANEPEILQRDFYNSLLAAYSIDEVKDQLRQSRLEHLAVKIVSDRHFIVSGYL